MTTAHSPAIDQAQIVRLLDGRVNAIRARDVDASLSNYSKNVLLFDVVTPLQYFGLHAVRDRVQEWYSSFQGPLEYEMHDLRIATDSDVAFSHSLNHISGTKTDGETIDMWWRATVCYRKMDDKWMITHEHNSAAFDGETGRAALDLKPM
jgi:uncharacterized protein (TIGR02246 family)